jgi:hypothetical protein
MRPPLLVHLSTASQRSAQAHERRTGGVMRFCLTTDFHLAEDDFEDEIEDDEFDDDEDKDEDDDEDEEDDEDTETWQVGGPPGTKVGCRVDLGS